MYCLWISSNLARDHSVSSTCCRWGNGSQPSTSSGYDSSCSAWRAVSRGRTRFTKQCLHTNLWCEDVLLLGAEYNDEGATVNRIMTVCEHWGTRVTYAIGNGSNVRAHLRRRHQAIFRTLSFCLRALLFQMVNSCYRGVYLTIFNALILILDF